jgi:hypothetical protein
MIPFKLNYYLKSLWAQAPGLVILQVSLTKLRPVRHCPGITSELQANDKHLPCSSTLGLSASGLTSNLCKVLYGCTSASFDTASEP